MCFNGLHYTPYGFAQKSKILLRLVSNEASFDAGVGRVRPPAVAKPPRRPSFKPQATVILLGKGHRSTL